MTDIATEDRMFAMVSTQGTACAETALCQPHYLVEDNRRDAEDRAPDYNEDPGLLWEDCTGNDALECQVCGKKGASA